ncbi:MAG: hypothetical protein JWL71_2643 [Acidobacteria bacterium]|nr:hypothetical protein [Acidobacteriota bacterium]
MKATPIALVCAMLVAAAAGAQDTAADPSLDRMRAVLQKAPLRLTVVEPEPTFKIEIHAIHPMHEIFDKPAWQLDPVGWQPPGAGFDLLSIYRMARDAKRAYDVRVARDGVQRAIADYCAAQPDANTIQICSASAAIR